MITNEPYDFIYNNCLKKMDIHINQFNKIVQQKIKKIFTSIFSEIDINQSKLINLPIQKKKHFLNILHNISELPSKYKLILKKSKKQIYEYFENNSEFYSFLRTQNIQDLFQKLNYHHFPTDTLNQFIVPEIFDTILNLRKKKKICSSYSSNKVNLNIFYTNSIDNRLIVIFLIKIYCLLELYNIHNQDFSLLLYFTDCKKQINNQYRILTSKNVNSGLTIHELNTFKIIIFREEEMEKVIIHELIHALNIDIPFRKDFQLYENSIKCHFNVSKTNQINIFEAFTESLGVYYNTLFNCILTNTDFYEVFTNEIKFSILQSIKILKFYKLSIHDFFNKDKCFVGNNDWIEKSSILSYYFLKTITILHIDDFFNKKINNNSSYVKFLIDNSSSFINLLHKYESLYSKCMTKSLRMTLYELSINI